MLKNNKLIILDLDGTLLKNDKTVSEENIKALIHFKEKGNKILFATARPPRDAYKYVPENLRDNPIICYNGACIIDKDKNVLYQNQIDRKSVMEFIKIAKNMRYSDLCLEINDILYSNFDTKDFFGKAKTNIVDLEKLEFEYAYKIIICSKEKINKDLLEKIPRSIKGIITDNGTLCQAINSEVSKWTSIQYLIEKLNIKKNDTIAFGDDYNDIEMIKNCGIGVAMGNAEEDVKNVADFVTETNMNDGVAKFIKEKCC